MPVRKLDGAYFGLTHGKNFIENPLFFKNVVKEYAEIKHAPASQAHSEVDLDGYDEFNALDEIIVGM